MKINKTLLPFLQSQKVLSIATLENELPWISNVYYSVNDEFEFFFFSATDTKHSRHLISNNNISFTTVWFNPKDESDRKAIQATGKCKRLTDPVKLLQMLKNHYQYFPTWVKDGEDLADTVKKLLKTGAYFIETDYIKYWNDAEFGEKKTEEYNLVR